MVDMIAVVEEGSRQLKDEEAADLRGHVCGALRRAQPPKDNLIRKQRMALKELKVMDDVVILPADTCKRNATVILKKEKYHEKMIGMLETTTYKKLKKDPIATQEGRLCRKFKGLEKNREISRDYIMNSDLQAVSPLEFTAFPKSRSLRSHLEQLFHDLGLQLTSFPSTLPSLYLH